MSVSKLKALDDNMLANMQDDLLAAQAVLRPAFKSACTTIGELAAENGFDDNSSSKLIPECETALWGAVSAYTGVVSTLLMIEEERQARGGSVDPQP